jgi:hypothetical protein
VNGVVICFILKTAFTENKYGDVMKKALKQVEKSEMLDKVKNGRSGLLEQNKGWLFRPLALCPFPAQPLKKRELIENGKHIEEHNVLWKRRTGTIEVEVLGHPEYGVPYGQDILIILFLAYEAIRQNSRKIKVKFFRDFCRMFDINIDDGRRFKNVANSLNRIENAKFSWKNKSEIDINRGFNYIYIDEINIYNSPKSPSQKSLFEQYILLSEKFWDEINKYKIPFNIEAVKYLKGRTSYLNFYVWLSYRVAVNYLIGKKKGEVLIDFIPFWGESGLINQLSTQITRRPDVRRQIKKWLKQTKELWPECPAEIEGDALKIQCTDKSQLDIQLDQQIEVGREIRKEIEEEKKDKKECPNCKAKMDFLRGKKGDDGRRWDDYYRCYDCQINFSQHKYPELF